ncbi:Gfo/Idh/MocA family oxidoreductase [Eubacteriales bacterium OttesenSCG-928-A19]|nr:Gfo/Idh/MocA family oxidoreductase [Eubacteriales bacterium OttesenSCG-928-A19]
MRDGIVGVGIIGAGNVGVMHIRAMEQVRAARVVAVADLNAATAARAATLAGCEVAASTEALLAMPEIDLVCVCLPPSQHCETAIAAARAGKHVLVEKPLDVSLASADRMIAACAQHGVLLGAVSQHRFDPAIRALSGLLAQGDLGRVLMASSRTIWYRSPEYYASAGGWRGSLAEQGGVLMSQAIHYIDLLQYLMGGVEATCAVCETLLHTDIEVEDTGLALLRFSGGAVGSIEATTIAYPGMQSEINLYAERATVCIRDDRLHFYAAKDGIIPMLDNLLEEEDTTPTAAGDPIALDLSSHRDQLQDMVDAVREGRAPMVDGEKGREPIAVIEAIHRSARQGGWVRL